MSERFQGLVFGVFLVALGIYAYSVYEEVNRLTPNVVVECYPKAPAVIQPREFSTSL